MSTITEALYVVEFGDIASSEYRNGGVAVLETGRIFGGDSGYYYLGSYTVDKAQLSGEAKIVKHNPLIPSVWGDNATEFDILLNGTLSGGIMTGHMQRVGTQIRLPIRLTRKSALP